MGETAKKLAQLVREVEKFNCQKSTQHAERQLRSDTARTKRYSNTAGQLLIRKMRVCEPSSNLSSKASASIKNCTNGMRHSKKASS